MYMTGRNGVRKRLLVAVTVFALLIAGCGQAAETDDTAPAGDRDAEAVEENGGSSGDDTDGNGDDN